MKRIGVFLFIALIYASGLLIYFANYIKQDILELEKLKLSYAIDYSSDAAILNLLSSLDLEMDYANKGYVSADPNMALDTFVDVFLFNYGVGIDNTNRAHVKMNFMPVFVVAMFDGYYMGTPRVVKNAVDYPEGAINDGDWALQFSPKLPYTYVNGGASYALNMGGDYSFRMSGNILSKEFGLPPGIASKADIRRQITKIISSDISYHIDKANENNPNWSNTFYIPGDITTLSNVSPLEGPSILAIVQNVDFATSRKIGAFSVGGSKIQTARMIAGYTRVGRKYYCYADKMPASVTAESIYATMDEAAKDGYSFDIEYMQ
jgi:hypothetical protein